MIEKSLKKLMFEKGYTQKKLGVELNVTQALISKWTTGKGQPQLEMLPKLAATLEVPVETIINCFTK